MTFAQLVSNSTAVALLLQAASEQVKRCAAAATKILSEAVWDLHGEEHSSAMFNAVALCSAGLVTGGFAAAVAVEAAGAVHGGEGPLPDCTPTVLMFALHQLALTALRQVAVAPCCPALVPELQQLLAPLPLADEGSEPLRLVDALHGVAVAMARSVATASRDAKGRRRHQLSPAVAAEAKSYGEFLLGMERDDSWHEERLRYSALPPPPGCKARQPVASPIAVQGGGRERPDSGDSSDAAKDALVREVLGKAPRKRLPNIKSLQAEYKRNGGWVVVPAILAPRFATRLRRHLGGLPPHAWHQCSWWVRQGEGPADESDRPLKLPNLPALAKELASARAAADEAAARGDFAYHFLRSSGGAGMEELDLEDADDRDELDLRLRCPHTPAKWALGPLCDLEAAMAAGPFRHLVAEITGVQVTPRFQDFFASWFRPGDYLTSHADAFVGRSIAFRLGLTPAEEWREGFGGDLVFDAASRAAQSVAPAATKHGGGRRRRAGGESDAGGTAAGLRLRGADFNTMLLFDVRTTDMGHSVTRVQAESNGTKRLAVTGWYE